MSPEEIVASAEADVDGRPLASMPRANRERYLLRARAALQALRDVGAHVETWQPIETAPRDGTLIDAWRDSSRETVYWGFPPHDCGEMGAYCDSDWHSIKQPGWICSTFGEFVGGKHDPFTHWMPLPRPPLAAAPGAGEE